MNLVFLTINHLNRSRYVKAVSILLFLLSFSIFSQSSDAPYEFPALYGVSEGGESLSHMDMINAYQIPEDILKNMSTKALLITCIQYPLFRDFSVYNDLQLGFERMASNFNGFKELFQRSDVGEAALQEYIKMPDLISPNAKNFGEKFAFIHLEMLLSQPSIINNLSLKGKKMLLQEVLKKYSAKNKQKGSYGSFSLTPSCLVLSRLLSGQVNSGNKELDLKVTKFTEKAFIADLKTMNAIINAAEKYLNN